MKKDTPIEYQLSNMVKRIVHNKLSTMPLNTDEDIKWCSWAIAETLIEYSFNNWEYIRLTKIIEKPKDLDLDEIEMFQHKDNPDLSFLSIEMALNEAQKKIGEAVRVKYIISNYVYMFTMPYTWVFDPSIIDIDEYYILFVTLDGKRQILFHSVGA